VPRLTLLFFGVAKEVPAAAPLSSRATIPEEVHHQRNHRYY
jgi:hypothetical protein